MQSCSPAVSRVSSFSNFIPFGHEKVQIFSFSNFIPFGHEKVQIAFHF
jgi:hypothetical protein